MVNNSKPLTYQTANRNDIVPLTPYYFIIGQIGGQFAPKLVDVETSYNPQQCQRRIQEMATHIWNRRMQELVPSLSSTCSTSHKRSS